MKILILIGAVVVAVILYFGIKYLIENVAIKQGKRK